MAIIDTRLMYSDDQVETTAAAHDSTNTLDLGAGYDAFGNALVADWARAGTDLFLTVLVTEAVTSGGAATVLFDLQDSADNSSFSSVKATSAIAKATLVAGYVAIKIALPKGLRRYSKIIYTIGTAALTAGKFSAWIGPADTRR
jgi:hypothetical protein